MGVLSKGRGYAFSLWLICTQYQTFVVMCLARRVSTGALARVHVHMCTIQSLSRAGMIAPTCAAERHRIHMHMCSI